MNTTEISQLLQITQMLYDFPLSDRYLAMIDSG